MASGLKHSTNSVGVVVILYGLQGALAFGAASATICGGTADRAPGAWPAINFWPGTDRWRVPAVGPYNPRFSEKPASVSLVLFSVNYPRDFGRE